MRKHVPLGENDYLNFESFINRDADAQDPEQEQVRREHDLDHPHEVLWSRSSHPAPAGDGRFEVTGQGKAGPMLSHATHALRELVDEHRPVSIEFSAKEPSRIKAYHHMMRRMAKEQTGGGEYEFLHEPGHSFRARNGVMIHEPAYFHIVHKAAADLPRYEGMERISGKRKARAGGHGRHDERRARCPPGGRPPGRRHGRRGHGQRRGERATYPRRQRPLRCAR